MEIRAYNEMYLPQAQRVLGDAFDFISDVPGADADSFMYAFIVSGYAAMFERGNPSVVAGINGCELVRMVAEKTGYPSPQKEDIMYADKSPSYWAGWALAFYQWLRARTFSSIRNAVPVSEVIRMYPLYHEADLTTFAEEMDRRLVDFYKETRLSSMRRNIGYSQRKLSEESGVPLRQIQLFEQRSRDINKTQAITLFRLGRALGCDMEALLEL